MWELSRTALLCCSFHRVFLLHYCLPYQQAIQPTPWGDFWTRPIRRERVPIHLWAGKGASGRWYVFSFLRKAWFVGCSSPPLPPPPLPWCCVCRNSSPCHPTLPSFPSGFYAGLSVKMASMNFGCSPPVTRQYLLLFLSFFLIWITDFFKVSHHPPAAAHYAESKNGWILRQEIKITSKFRGKYLSIMPLGKATIFVRTSAPGIRNLWHGRVRRLKVWFGPWTLLLALHKSFNVSAVDWVRRHEALRTYPIIHFLSS